MIASCTIAILSVKLECVFRLFSICNALQSLAALYPDPRSTPPRGLVLLVASLVVVLCHCRAIVFHNLLFVCSNSARGEILHSTHHTSVMNGDITLVQPRSGVVVVGMLNVSSGKAHLPEAGLMIRVALLDGI